MIVNFNNKDFELKNSIRAHLMLENISDNFDPTKMSDMLTFLYCLVVTSMKDYSYTFDNFIDEIDETPSKLNTITEWLNSITTNENTLKKN